jgi:hypothetical protein
MFQSFEMIQTSRRECAGRSAALATHATIKLTTKIQEATPNDRTKFRRLRAGEELLFLTVRAGLKLRGARAKVSLPSRVCLRGKTHAASAARIK